MFVGPHLLGWSDLLLLRALTVSFLPQRDLEAFRCTSLRYARSSVAYWEARADEALVYETQSHSDFQDD